MSNSQKQSVVVLGPKMCGKTRNQAALRRYFGLFQVIDDYCPPDPIPRYGTLVLTNFDQVRERAKKARIAVHDFGKIAKLAGCK